MSQTPNINLLLEYKKTDCFDASRNGIQLVEHEDRVEIFSDPFCTVPFFLAKDRTGSLFAFSDFRDFYALKNVSRSIDKTGFWEIVLFGSGLSARTLYQSARQLPSACKVTIKHGDNNYSIEKYWDFHVREDPEIDTMRQAVSGLFNRLDAMFSRLDRSQRYLMGMSGGLDSRVTLAFLSRYIPRENLTLFTFGSDERTLEYTHAREVASACGFNPPIFHKLTVDSYRRAESYMPEMSGGQIGINHAHIVDFLSDGDWQGYVQISNYYSDALFGYESTAPKTVGDIEDNSYLKTILSFELLSDEVKQQVRSDSLEVFKTYRAASNFSSLDEFKYLTERNQKFHIHLAAIQANFVPTKLIYADLELLTYMLSVPIELRQQKKMLDCMLSTYFDDLKLDDLRNISSRDFRSTSSSFQWADRAAGLIDWYRFKLINRANAALRVFTMGRVQLPNKFQTEEQARLLYRDFSIDLRTATSRFVSLGILTEAQKAQWDKLPYGSAGVSERYAMISISKLLGES